MIIVDNEHRIVRVTEDKGKDQVSSGSLWFEICAIKFEKDGTVSNKVIRLIEEDAVKLAKYIICETRTILD